MASSGAAHAHSNLRASIRYRMQSRMDVDVLELNECGCMVDSRGWSVKPTERVLIRLPGLGEVGAEVIWLEDQRAGLAFEETLYSPIVESLLAQV